VTATQNSSPDTSTSANAAAERRYATVNPFTGETEKEFDFTPTEAIDGIIERAHAAFGQWRLKPVQERADVVRRAADLMDERRAALAALITTEMGKRTEEATGELQLCAMILRYYADNGPGFLAPTSITPMMGKGEAVVETRPIGVLLAIEPWNYPFYQVVRVAGPNLVLGNTVILKHAEITPQCAVAVEQLFLDAGAPEGVFTNTFLHIADVEQVIADPRIQGVTLTGSERAGSSVAALAGKHLKKGSPDSSVGGSSWQ
jgi:succinate-semialdehyde dehydrogenase/glutarate-semialdehyde dehydrogenase